MSPEAVVTQEASLQAIKIVCCVYTEKFLNLRETHEFYDGKDRGESADLLLFESLYNVRRRH